MSKELSKTNNKIRVAGFEDRGVGKISDEERHLLRKELIKAHARGQNIVSLIHTYDYPQDVLENELNNAIESLTEHFLEASAAKSFALYATFHFDIIKDLDSVLSTLHQELKQGNAKASTALVSGLKAKSDLFDKIYDKGESYQIISSKPTEIDDLVMNTETKDLLNKVVEGMKDSKKLLNELRGESRLPKKKKSEMKVKQVRVTQRGVKLADNPREFEVLDHNEDHKRVKKLAQQSLEDLNNLEAEATELKFEVTYGEDLDCEE